MLPLEGKIKINDPVFRRSLSMTLTAALRPVMDRITKSFNAQQKLYPDERNPTVFPLRVFGYEIVSATTVSCTDESKNQTISIVFRSRPLPYAFTGSDDGVTETAGQSIALDLRDAILRAAPAEVRKPHATARELIDHWANHGSEKSVDTSKIFLAITVHLDRSTSSVPKVQYTVPLEEHTAQ